MRNLISKLFLDHPASVGESYFQHLFMASRFATRMFIGSVACFLHGVFPFLCTKTGSDIVTDLHSTMVKHRSKIATSEAYQGQTNNPQNAAS